MIAILAGFLTVVPAVQDGDLTQRIMDRIDTELREYRLRLFAEVRKTIREELRRAESRLEKDEPADPPARGVRVFLGITVDEFTDAERKALDVPGGLKIAGVRGPAQKAGVRAGDVLLEIGGTSVTERNIVKTLSRYAPGDKASLEVLRSGERRTLTVGFAGRKD